MIAFIAFAFYLCIGATILVALPVMAVSGLPMRKKLLIVGFAFFVLVPVGMALYAWLGAPQMATS